LARILITSGPTREYLDPIRFLTNASSGKMGCALTEAALAGGHEVVIVSGPVSVAYPQDATLFSVISTDEMLTIARREFPKCDGAIGVAAPCDYKPVRVADQKISKTGDGLMLDLIETEDVIATLGAEKEHRWIVGFALETEDHRFRAITKAEKKRCDLMILNSPSAMSSLTTDVELLDRGGRVLARYQGSKSEVSRQIFEMIGKILIPK